MKHTLPILLLMLLGGFNIQAQSPLAQYSFSGSAKDGTVNANHAQVNGARLTTDRFGIAGRAFAFDGIQSSVTAANSDVLNTGTATISFWVKPEEFPAQGEVFILSNGGWQQRWKISLPSHGKPVFTTHANGACCSDMDSGNPLQLGQWTHLVMVHDGSKDIIYVNGVKANEKNTGGNLDATDYPLGIGFDPIDQNFYFKGAIDEVEIYGTALTDTEIAGLFAEQNTPPSSVDAIVADFAFDGNTEDGSEWANHANRSGGKFITDRFGFGKHALQLDGSSHVTAPASDALNSGTATIGFWVKPNSFPGTGEVFLLSHGGWQERWKISLPSHGKPVFTTHSNGACCSDMDSGTPLELKKWTHVVMVHDGSSDVIYFNGNKVNAKAVSGMLDDTQHPLGIGWDPIDKGGFFDGSFDDVVLINKAMTETEVNAWYQVEAVFPGTQSDLVASYSMNGNGDDDTDFHNNGITNDEAHGTVNRFGRANNALTGTVTADNSAALQSDFTTISFWVKPTQFPGSGEVFLMSNGGWQERWKISLPSHGKPVFTTHANGACCSDMDSGTPLALNTWTHVAMVHDGSQDIIYFNGVRVDEKSVSGGLDKTQHPLGIGWDPIDKGGIFDGAIDDVAIYNRALSDAEISQLYGDQSVETPIAGNLVARYAFDNNGTDGTAYNNDAAGYFPGKDRFGKANKGAAFKNVGSEVRAENSPQLNGSTTTVSFWINPASYASNGEYYLLSFGGWQERWKISLPSHGKPVWTTNHSNGISDMDSGDGNTLPLNTWTHVAMVHDGNKDLIYFNGELVAEKNVVGTLNATTHPLGIGYNAVDGGSWFDGLMDEVQIFNTGLDAAAIKALYDSQALEEGGDDEAPDAPLNLDGLVNFNNVLLTWRPSSDNLAVVAYNVYIYNELEAITPATEQYFALLTPLTEYLFGVSAIDAAGNESAITTLKVTTGPDESPDVTPPTAPGNLRGTPSFSSVLLAWDPSIDDRKVDGYIMWVDGVYYDSLAPEVVSVLVSGLDANTAYSFEIAAYDLSGNLSAVSELTLSTTEPLDTGEPGLVAHYPFEGNANDATPYLNHGVAGGNVSYETATHPLGGMNVKFDGDGDSILCPNAVQLLSEYTSVSFWIRVDGKNIADAEAYVMDFGHWDQRWKISLPQHLKIVWTTNSNNTQFPNFISDMDSKDGNELVQGFWWHVTMVHDGADDVIYVNGQEVNRKPAPGKLNATTRSLCFGNNPIEGGQYFIGALDNVKIYNKALTGEEINQLYQTGTTSSKEQQWVYEYIQGVFPNPAVDQLVIQHSLEGAAVDLRVIDAMGRQIGSQKITSDALRSKKIVVDVSSYPSGLYQVNFVTGGKSLGSIGFVKR
ncbi:MAG: T9SS type A sorting domain-containing protein [Saprospiraceae bacterium]|nr:T9SS type A sorting domain-containing protein [Saprospiraceae bacterium]